MVLALSRPAVVVPRWVVRIMPLAAYAFTVALAAVLPFEPVRPLASLPWLELNELKLLAAAAALAWAVETLALRHLGRRLRLPWDVLGPAIAFLAIATLSALAAPDHRADALKFVGRLASGLLVLGLALHVGSSSRLLWAIALGAGASACLGLAEATGLPQFVPVLAFFKTAPTYVGGDLRISASFQYATIAAQYFEMAVPVAIGLAATTRGWLRLLALGVAALCVVNIVLTLTRAGIAALALVLVTLGLLAWRRGYGRALAAPAGLTLAVLIGTFGALASRGPALATRLSTENDLGWYGATYSAPASLDLTEATTDVTIVASNTGQTAWTTDGDRAFAMGVRWLSADGAATLDVPHAEIPLQREVAPGESVEVHVPLRASLPPGAYRIAWGMLQHDILWFHYRGSADAETLVRVEPSASAPTAAAPPTVTPRDDAIAYPTTVPRLALWQTALRMFASRPLLGVGPDNFRHLYGSYLNISPPDERVHANNLYLELLADVGIAGALAFLALLLPAGRVLVRTLRTRAWTQASIWRLCLGASVAVFLLHGTFDYFLEFTPVYMLFWMIVGLVLAESRA